MLYSESLHIFYLKETKSSVIQGCILSEELFNFSNTVV